MANVAELIERAANRTGSEYKLAKALGIAQQTLSNWKHGRRNCVPADRARIAGFAGEDALQELVRATLEDNAGTVKGEQLQRVLGKSSRQTGAVYVSAMLPLASLTYGTSQLIRCILLLSRWEHSPARA